MMVQRAPLTKAEKEFILQRKRVGATLGQIAQELACSLETTRKWWRLGQKGCLQRPRGRPKRGALSTYPEALRVKAVELKRAHAHWGPASIKLELERDAQWQGVQLPSDARLSVLFREVCPDAVQPRSRRPTRPQSCTVKNPHQRWQLDAKEGVRVGNQFANLLEVCDRFTGLMIAAQAFITTTPKRWRRLSLAEQQQTLRWAFQSWGLPLEVQTDQDGVYIPTEDPQFPSLFTLWLVGLGVTHVTSRPYRPTDQGSIERNHRTLGDFAYQDQQFEQLPDLQQALDQHRLRYNQAFPSQAAHCNGHPPLVAFPDARSTGRPYHPGAEWELFRLERIDAYLAQFVWTRPVMTNGIVHLGKQRYYVGRRFKGQRVSIQFLPAIRSFHFQTADGQWSKDIRARGLSKEDILGFVPAHLALPVGFQYPLPLKGV
jgi:transposase InsO family protein